MWNMKKRISSEYHECLAFFKWAQFNPVLRDYLIKIVNEGQRSKTNGYYLKLIGFRAGLPDYFLPVANSSHQGLWLEMKTVDERNKKKRDNQNNWIDSLNKIGHYATYVYGWQDAAKITTDYLNNRI